LGFSLPQHRAGISVSKIRGQAPDNLPSYRDKLSTPVRGQWAGPFGTSAVQLVSASGVPDFAATPLFTASLTQSLAELEDLANLNEDPGIGWDPQHVGYYNSWIDEGKVPHIDMMGLVSAQRVLTRAVLRGIINTVRNTALDFALELQTTDPKAGTQNGPTIAEPSIASTVFNITNNIYGDGTTIAHGDGTSVAVTVQKNDVESLIAAARGLGLSEEGIVELRQAAEAPEADRPNRFKALLTRVGAGALSLTSNISAEVAASQVDQLIQQFLGQA
ncbi:hypothetical protein, partial [Microbacterium paludicola]|uniref:AbiTii domain-containing protein n=1 Tax=Microbacterium paludicola TaxID=300019 RepID=UPI0031DD594B